MKRNLSLFISVMAVMAIIAIGLTACGTDEIFNRETKLSDKIHIKNVKAHYVDEMVIIDFQVENRTNEDITDLSLEVNKVNVEPEDGYSGKCYVSAGQGSTWNLFGTKISLSRGETRNMRVGIDRTDQATANRFSVTLRGQSSRFGTLDDPTITMSGTITDTRATSNTIWSNDDLLSYTNWQCTRNGDALIASFEITNRTGIDLNDLVLEAQYCNNGNGSNFTPYFVLDNENNVLYSTKITINNGDSRTVKIYLPEFFTRTAYCFNARLKVSSNHYEFASTYAHIVALNPTGTYAPLFR